MADKKISDLTFAPFLDPNAIIECTIPGSPNLTRALSVAWFPTIIREIDIGDETTPLTTGLKATFRWRNTGLATQIYIDASLTTAQASGATKVTIDVKKNGTSMFSTKLTFDNGETSTWTASVPSVLSGTPSINIDDEITIFVDAIQSGSAAAGLKVAISGVN